MNRNQLYHAAPLWAFLGVLVLLGSLAIWKWTHPTRFKLISNLPQVTSVTFSPDEKIVAIAATAYTIRPVVPRELCLWHTETGKFKRCLIYENDKQGKITDVQFSPDGKILKALADEEWRAYEVNTGKLISSEPNQKKSGLTESVDLRNGLDKVFSGDGLTYASAVNNLKTGNPWVSSSRLKLYDTRTNTQLTDVYFTHTDWSQVRFWNKGSILRLEFSPRDTFLGIGTGMGETRILRLKGKPSVVILASMDSLEGICWNVLGIYLLLVYAAVLNFTANKLKRNLLPSRRTYQV
jgi:WD40 repeat protein